MNVTALVAFEANEGTTSRRKTLYPPVVAQGVIYFSALLLR
jgi:hypothetical protein